MLEEHLKKQKLSVGLQEEPEHNSNYHRSLLLEAHSTNCVLKPSTLGTQLIMQSINTAWFLSVSIPILVSDLVNGDTEDADTGVHTHTHTHTRICTYRSSLTNTLVLPIPPCIQPSGPVTSRLVLLFLAHLTFHAQYHLLCALITLDQNLNFPSN